MTKKEKADYIARVNKKLALIYMHMVCEADKALKHA